MRRFFEVRLVAVAVVEAKDEFEARDWVDRHELNGFHCYPHAHAIESAADIPNGWHGLQPFHADKGLAEEQLFHPTPGCAILAFERLADLVKEDR